MRNKIAILAEKDVADIVDVLFDAFYDYPVMRYVLHKAANYDEQLKTLLHFFTMARILRGETIFGARQKSRLIGVALTSNPAQSQKIPRLISLREKTWHTLGQQAKNRYEKLGRVWMDLDTGIPNIHLNMLAVRHEIQGSGAGRQLLNQVHALSKKNPHSEGVTLTTEDPDKVSFYQYMGYQITGQAKVEENLHTWNFFRGD